MDPFVILQQMLVIFALMIIGVLSCRWGKLTPDTSKNISWLVINFCGPALAIASVVSGGNTVTRESLITVGGAALCSYIFLIAVSYILPILVRAPKDEKITYQMLTIFCNVGFIGYPVTLALLGPEAMIYTAVFNFMFNIIAYTYGIYIMKRAAGRMEGRGWRAIINTGTVVNAAAVVICWFHIPVAEPIANFFTYVGNASVFLSLIVIGASLAKIKLREIFGDMRMVIFLVIRYVLIPIGAAICLRPILTDYLIRGVTILMMSMPGASIIAMFAKQYDIDDTSIVKGIVLTTVTSVITITIVGTFI